MPIIYIKETTRWVHCTNRKTPQILHYNSHKCKQFSPSQWHYIVLLALACLHGAQNKNWKISLGHSYVCLDINKSASWRSPNPSTRPKDKRAKGWRTTLKAEQRGVCAEPLANRPPFLLIGIIQIFVPATILFCFRLWCFCVMFCVHKILCKLLCWLCPTLAFKWIV